MNTSVWIGNLRGLDREPVRKLQTIDAATDILVGDLVLLEVLQGTHDDRHVTKIEEALRQFRIVRMLDEGLAVRAAQHYRFLRGNGITVRKTVDVIIATFCIVRDHVLLHDDRDFDTFARHLGLKTM